MKRIATPIQTRNLCSYGCGNVALFVNGSGRFMCAERSQKCHAVKSKNSFGVAKAHKEGKIPISQLDGKRAWSKGLTLEDPRIAAGANKRRGKPRIGTPHTEEAKRKISEFRTKWLKNPENRKNYGRGKKSWMELCFEKWLTENQFKNWEYDKHFWNEVGRKNYYADFCFEELKLIVELDGTQHLKSIEQDAIRDQYLNSIGYKVVRITHKEFKQRFFSDKGFFDILGR